MAIKILGSGWLKIQGAQANFAIKCGKCGSENVSIVDGLAMGSEWTGMYGSIDIKCDDCDNVAEIYS